MKHSLTIFGCDFMSDSNTVRRHTHIDRRCIELIPKGKIHAHKRTESADLFANLFAFSPIVLCAVIWAIIHWFVFSVSLNLLSEQCIWNVQLSACIGTWVIWLLLYDYSSYSNKMHTIQWKFQRILTNSLSLP